jgi:hypothetical protein
LDFRIPSNRRWQGFTPPIAAGRNPSPSQVFMSNRGIVITEFCATARAYLKRGAAFIVVRSFGELIVETNWTDVFHGNCELK